MTQCHADWRPAPSADEAMAHAVRFGRHGSGAWLLLSDDGEFTTLHMVWIAVAFGDDDSIEVIDPDGLPRTLVATDLVRPVSLLGEAVPWPAPGEVVDVDVDEDAVREHHRLALLSAVGGRDPHAHLYELLDMARAGIAEGRWPAEQALAVRLACARAGESAVGAVEGVERRDEERFAMTEEASSERAKDGDAVAELDANKGGV